MRAKTAAGAAAWFAVWTLASLSPGFAQTPEAPGPASSAADARPPLEQSARHTDAHADRVILVPTAETQPVGTLYASSYEVVVLGVGFALSDRIQLSATGVTDFDNRFVELSLKANLLRSRWLRIAAQSAIDHAGGNGQSLVFGRAGGTLQLCFDLPCGTSFSLGATLVAFDEPNTVLPAGFGAGFTIRLSDDVSGLLEYSAIINAARDLGFIDLPIYVVGYGLRIAAHTSWALDLTMLRRMQGDAEIRTGGTSLFDLLGVPFVVFTYRGKP
jgi:hypothetical protein